MSRRIAFCQFWLANRMLATRLSTSWRWMFTAHMGLGTTLTCIRVLSGRRNNVITNNYLLLHQNAMNSALNVKAKTPLIRLVVDLLNNKSHDKLYDNIFVVGFRFLWTWCATCYGFFLLYNKCTTNRSGDWASAVCWQLQLLAFNEQQQQLLSILQTTTPCHLTLVYWSSYQSSL